MNNVEAACLVLHRELQMKLNYTHRKLTVDRIYEIVVMLTGERDSFFTVSTFAPQFQEPFL